MNENNKSLKNVITILLTLIIIISLGLCFVITYKNHKTNTNIDDTNNNKASDISSNYSDIDYGESEELDSNQDSITITSGGSYDLTGTYGCINVNTNANVELNLNNATISCTTGPGIYVEDAKTVSITLTEKNKVTSTTTDSLDGAIYSKQDIIFSGSGSLEISSNYDGIVSKDTLVINSGTYVINASDDGIRGKDSVAIVDGTFTINALGDGIKSTNDEDTSLGYVVIDNGTFNITSVTDAIQAETKLQIKDGTFNIKTSGNTNTVSAKGLKAGTLIQIDGGSFTINTTDDAVHSNKDLIINKGTFTITSKDDGVHADGMITINGGVLTINSSEGIEATYVKINDGDVTINASDDGINASNKSSDYKVTIEINGGNIIIKMGQGDTDGIDSNGNLYINGGTINITCNSPFDYDGESKYTGGTIIVNGETTNTITNQMMGGGGMDGRNMMPGRR